MWSSMFNDSHAWMKVDGFYLGLTCIFESHLHFLTLPDYVNGSLAVKTNLNQGSENGNFPLLYVFKMFLNT